MSDIKVIAFYFPKYHPISENNECWGKGITALIESVQT